MTQLALHTDSDLLTSYVATRDADAFAELVRRHARLVLGAARRVTGNTDDAEDVVQSCFLELAQNAVAIRGSVAGWLHQAACSRAFDVVRSRSARKHREAARAAAEARRPQTPHELIERRVDETLLLLPEDLRTLLVRHYLQSVSQQDLARELGLTQPSVSRRIAKGIELLRSKLDGSGTFLSVPVLASVLEQMAAQVQVPAHLLARMGKLVLAGPPAHPAPLAAAKAVWTAPARWAIAAVALLVASAGLYVLWPTRSHDSIGAGVARVAAPLPQTPAPQAPQSPQIVPLPPEGATWNDASPTFHGNNRRTGLVRATGVPQLHQMAWTFKTGGRVLASPTIHGSRVYVGSEDGTFHALRLSDGAPAWTYRADSPIRSSAAIDAGRVYFAASDGRVHCLDAGSGAVRWIQQTEDARHPAADERVPPQVWQAWRLSTDQAMLDPWDSFHSSPAVADGRVFIGTYGGGVEALNAEDGKRLWRVQTEGPVRSSPAIADGRVYVGGFDGTVRAIEPVTGRLLWTFGWAMQAAHEVQSSVTVGAELIYCGCRNGFLHALEPATGRERWRLPYNGSWVVTTPVFDGARLYVGSSHARFVQCLDARTGAQIWRTPTKQNVFSSPALASGILYFGDMNPDAAGRPATFYAVRADSGAVLWTVDVPAAIQSSPGIADGLVIFGCDDGMVRAIR